MIDRFRIYFFIAVFAAVALIAFMYFGGCFFGIRQLPRTAIAIIGMLCAIVLVGACLLVLLLFMRSFGRRVSGHWVVSGRAASIFIILVVSYTLFVLFCAKKYCGW